MVFLDVTGNSRSHPSKNRLQALKKCRTQGDPPLLGSFWAKSESKQSEQWRWDHWRFLCFYVQFLPFNSLDNSQKGCAGSGRAAECYLQTTFREQAIFSSMYSHKQTITSVSSSGGKLSLFIDSMDLEYNKRALCMMNYYYHLFSRHFNFANLEWKYCAELKFRDFDESPFFEGH